jgi:hypothetical protein
MRWRWRRGERFWGSDMRRGVLLLTTLTLFAQAPVYRSISVDESGQLDIVLDSGSEQMPRKIQGQVSFDSPQISADRRTVGWLVNYPFPTTDLKYSRDHPITGSL